MGTVPARLRRSKRAKCEGVASAMRNGRLERGARRRCGVGVVYGVRLAKEPMTTTLRWLGGVLLVAAALPAQWTTVRPSAFTPSGGAVAGYDPVSGEAYLIQVQGGAVPMTMWRFDDGIWTQLTQPAAQPPTAGATCSWPGHGLLVQGAGTWVWNGTAWTQIPTAITPPGLHGMDWDPVRGVVVGLGQNLQTWEFDGTNWQLRATAWPMVGPPVTQARVAWEPITQTMIAVAGTATGSALPGCPIYRWNGSAWNILGGGTRVGFAITSVPARGVFFSGGFEFPASWGNTGIWNGSQWTFVGSGGPNARASSLSWYDAGRNRLVVTSGLGTAPASPSFPCFGTWYWNGTQWTRPAVGNGPGLPGTQVYDSWRGRTLQFGGALGYGIEHDILWARGSNGLWTSLGQGPQARHLHASAFDSRRGRLIVFGGCDTEPGGGSNYLVDAHTTWEWDGQTWHSFPSPSPQWSQLGFPVGRVQAAMAHDRTRDRCVLFGGNFGYGHPMPSGYQNDTWEWNGSTWTRMQPVHVPPAVEAPSLWYDAASGMCMLWANGLWSWNGVDWQAQPAPALPAPIATVAFDPSREVLVCFSNLGVHELRNGAWLPVSARRDSIGGFDLGRGAFSAVDNAYWYDVGDPAAATLAPFGTGCPGTAGSPVLHGEAPFRIGTTRTVHLANTPPNAPFFGMLGSDTDTYLGQPLPIDLTAAGMPQCALRTEIAAHELRSGSDWPIAVPGTTLLLGQRLRLQAFVFDAGANALGATTSNGLRVRVGP